MRIIQTYELIQISAGNQDYVNNGKVIGGILGLVIAFPLFAIASGFNAAYPNDFIAQLAPFGILAAGYYVGCGIGAGIGMVLNSCISTEV